MIFFKRKVQLIRSESGFYDDNGMYHKPTANETAIDANVQPATELDVEMLPDGARTFRIVKLFTNEILYSGQQKANGIQGCEADIIVVDGVQYIVKMCNAYMSGVLPHYESLAVELGEVKADEL